REKAKREVSIFTCSNRAVALFEQVKPSGNGIAMAALLFLLLFFSFGFSGFFMEMRRKDTCLLNDHYPYSSTALLDCPVIVLNCCANNFISLFVFPSANHCSFSNL
ncbi:MAG TPA: hypothetical protein VH593_01635, partial [Ktedonobacteraceae bacterium]